MSRIKDKIEEIRKFLDELEQIKPESLEKYSSDIKEKAACERYVEKIVEAVTDLAYLLIKEKELGKPGDDQSAYLILKEEGIITSESYAKIKEAKGMKNIISHQYGNVDDEIVYETITEELYEDIENFLKDIEKT